MFFLLPIWHEEGWRFPPCTTFLVLANLIIFLVVWPIEKGGGRTVTKDDLTASAQKLVQIVLGENSGVSPDLQEKIRLEKDVYPFPSDALTSYFSLVEENKYRLKGPARYDWDTYYPVFQTQRISKPQQEHSSTPYRRYGFNPWGRWFPGIITHQFLHYGWFHLAGNLLFLWIVGCLLETHIHWHLAWLYVLGGMAAALTQVVWGLPKGESMVGASGAISALMGFSLWAFPREKVKLFYFLLLFVSVRFGTFDSPLWACLPLWILAQVVVALSHTKVAPVTVAYGAHIGGFVFGILLAVFYRILEPPPRVKESYF